MEEKMEGKSIFDILDFVVNTEKAHYTSKGILFDCKDADIGISESLEKILAKQDHENQTIHTHDAAVFSAYFGIPNDEEKRLLWDKLSFSEKTSEILNVFSEGGYTSFTKILWSFSFIYYSFVNRPIVC